MSSKTRWIIHREMRQILITGEFIGRDGSLGYKKGQKYELTMVSNFADGSTTVFCNNHLPCVYQSAYSFLENWTNIKHIK